MGALLSDNGVRRMPLHRTAALGAALALLLAATAEAAPCFTAQEKPAALLRVAQQEFSVAALNCRGGADSDLRRRYNAFVEAFATTLKENASALRRHFARAGGERRLDSWMTLVANDAAGRAAIDPASYCRRASETLDRVLALKPTELTAFVATLEAPAEVVPACRTARSKPARKHRVASAAATK